MTEFDKNHPTRLIGFLKGLEDLIDEYHADICLLDDTSFHGITFTSSIQDLINVLGQPQYIDNSGEDKVNFSWEMETDEGDIFTIYDWKEYRTLDLNETIEWHIGSFSKSVSNLAQYEVLRELGNYVK